MAVTHQQTQRCANKGGEEEEEEDCSQTNMDVINVGIKILNAERKYNKTLWISTLLLFDSQLITHVPNMEAVL